MFRRSKRRWGQLGISLAWILLWEVAARLFGRPLFFPGPLAVAAALGRLLPTAEFHLRALTSLGHIGFGFLLATLSGIFLGWGAGKMPLLAAWMAPPVHLMQAVPVASLVILALFWLSSAHLSVLVVFLIVFPLLYENTRKGRSSLDPALSEMAQVFQISRLRRWRVIELPQVARFITPALANGVGMAWKAGTAAEVIALSSRTLGEALYNAKLTLSMDALFAWTVWILSLSVVTSALVRYLWARLVEALGRLGPARAAAWPAGSVQTISSANAAPAGHASAASQTAAPAAAPQAAPPIATPLLSLRNASKTFDGQAVWERLDLDLAPGHRLFLTGPSGIGKTTLLRVLAGTLPLDSGQVMRRGSAQGASSAAAHRTPEGKTLSTDSARGPQSQALRIAMLFQEDRLVEDATLEENLRLVGVTEENIREGLAALGLGAVAKRPAAELSGGMKRRVAILRALGAEKDVVLLDEPTNGLDADTREETLAWMRGQLGDAAVVLVSHRPEDAEALGIHDVFSLGSEKILL